jgi:hypothetical protein
VLEGESASNPMDPYGRRMGELIPGIAYLAPGSSAAMRTAVDKNYHTHHRVDKDVTQKRCAWLRAAVCSLA